MAVKTSKSSEAYYARYKSTGYAANRKRKLTRILKQQPNNEQVKNALSDIHYRRKTPNTSVWTTATARAAHVVKAWRTTDAADQNKTIQQTHMFSLKARMKNSGEFLFADATKITGVAS